ncbi:penicillin acylase family protein [Xanthomonadaceae bacterium JHOS43]|nr:penicillin acylase family protein [Xanthomonadaceae bacterium JHOS43]
MNNTQNTAVRKRTLIALAIASIFAANAASAETIQGPGLSQPGTITYDAEGIPTVTAATDEDAAWLMGYNHARTRFFQMDTLRRGASGTVAELVGAAGLAQDIQVRTLGLRRAAWETWAKYPAELRGQLTAYAHGVNAWLATHPLPVEYGALELTSADPWTPVDSVVIGKLLAYQLSFDLEIDYTIRLGAYQQAGAAAGFDGNALFFGDTHRSAPPDARASIPDFVPGGASASTQAKAGGADALPKSGAAPTSAPLDPSLLSLAETYRDQIANNPIIAPHLKRREDRAGSNWWIVGGEHTASGRPILANDPHLSLGTPMLFQEGHVVSNDPRYSQPMNTVGSIAPGTPWPLLGCTSDFCWGLTTNSLDVTDTYQEQFVLNSYGLPTHTIYNGTREPVLWVFQSYFVNQVGDGVADNVVRNNSIGYTNGGITIVVPRRNNGPVVSITGNTGLSIQYTGWGPTFELEAFRRINRASNLDEFRAAVQYFDVGSQNFAYADKEGNIAYFISAEAPIREDLQAGTVNGVPPFIIRSGTGGNEWMRPQNRYPAQHVPYEILSPEEMPYSINPARGYIANANNDPVGTTFDNNPVNQARPNGGILYYAPGHSSYRMGRIDRELQSLIERGNITIPDMMKLQANVQQLDAELVLPHVLNARANVESCGYDDDATLAEALDRLAAWDFSTPTGIREGYDAGDHPFALPEPSEAEISRSVGATLWAVTRGQLIRNTIDYTLSNVGLSSYLPGANEAYAGLKFQLDAFGPLGGKGASGLDFFRKVSSDLATAPADVRRDCVLLGSVRDGLNLLASEAFAPAFGGSTDLNDYRWGKLHRITFRHTLGDALSIPGIAGYPFQNLAEGLPGLARQGGFDVVDASGHNARANSVNGFTFGSGPVRRFIGEMTDTPTLLQIAPGGQDGNPGGMGYISQLPLWLVNGYKPLVIDPDVSEAGAVMRMEFAPR